MCRLGLSGACQDSKNVHTGSDSKTIKSLFSRRKREKNKYQGEAALDHIGICLLGSRCHTLSLQGPEGPNAPMLIDIPIKEVSRPRETEESRGVIVVGWSEREGWGSKSGGRPKTHFREKNKNKKYDTMCLRGDLGELYRPMCTPFFFFLSFSERAKATVEGNGACQLADGALTYFGMSHSSWSC